MADCSLHAAELAASPDPALRDLPYCLLCALDPEPEAVALNASADPRPDLPLVTIDLMFDWSAREAPPALDLTGSQPPN